jgi:3-oxoadipate enol-lactonase
VPSTTINGIDIAYERSGSGPRLLFVNGTGATLDRSGPMISAFTNDFDVLAFDQRGLGRSSCPEDPYTMADLAADALALTDRVGWETFRLAGISFGGMVSQEVAVTAPERIERLALMCTSSGGRGGSSFPLETLVDLEPTERARRSAEILDTRFTPEWLASHDGDRALVDLLATQFLAERPADARRGEELQLRARQGHDVYDRLPRITCPTLVAAGRTDGIAPPANGAAIAAQISGAELQIFDGGHIFFVQDPTAFPAILEFLGER